jgi:hypothetical protein
MPRSKPRGPLLPGAHKLRAFLDSLGTNVPDWCADVGLDRFKVQRVMNGRTQRVDVEFAGEIRDATMQSGRPVVDYQDWRRPKEAEAAAPVAKAKARPRRTSRRSKDDGPKSSRSPSLARTPKAPRKAA